MVLGEMSPAFFLPKIGVLLAAQHACQHQKKKKMTSSSTATPLVTASIPCAAAVALLTPLSEWKLQQLLHVEVGWGREGRE